ncbi:MAG TPA: hypothetical protein VFJ91_09140 [Gaiellaceae bacterium]|nr:hypothetical protein [Gaiellaceae bacterium]
MSEQNDNRTNDVEGWPMPSRDVLRDLERAPVAWPEQRNDAEAPVPAAA